jgi:tetratricopeptide (TPR) repeat protein
MLLRTWIAVAGAALLSGPAGHADDTANTVIGVNPRLSEGAYALEFGNYDEGIRLTLEGLRTTVRPRDRVGAFSNLCAGYVGIQDYESALRYCNRALRLDESNWHAYNNRSLAYLGLGNTAAAERDLEKGLEINPNARTLKEVGARIQAVKQAAAAQKRAPVSTEPEETLPQED